MITNDVEKNDRSRKISVADLIAILSTQPHARCVIVDDYEGEFEDIDSVNAIANWPDANTHPQFFGGEPVTIPNDCGGRNTLVARARSL